MEHEGGSCMELKWVPINSTSTKGKLEKEDRG